MAEGQCYYSAKWYVDDCSRHVCQSLHVNVTIQLDETGDPATNISAYFKLIFEPLTPINVYRKTPRPSDRVIHQDAWETEARNAGAGFTKALKYGPPCKLPDSTGFGRCSIDGQCYPTLPGYYDRDLDVYVRQTKPTIGRWSEPAPGPVRNAAAKTTTTTDVCENQDIRVFHIETMQKFSPNNEFQAFAIFLLKFTRLMISEGLESCAKTIPVGVKLVFAHPQQDQAIIKSRNQFGGSNSCQTPLVQQSKESIMSQTPEIGFLLHLGDIDALTKSTIRAW
uniref:Uncharacterized protein n=1 Tax=Romanomermis culicivorax TaxID=13658 RepID=A0A915KLM0_ROMCU